eukprot:3689192-Prorocentrum_lima.AAC.1
MASLFVTTLGYSHNMHVATLSSTTVCYVLPTPHTIFMVVLVQDSAEAKDISQALQELITALCGIGPPISQVP